MKVKSESEVAQSCPTLCDPIDNSLPGSSAHGIFQSRVLEWVAIAFSEHFLTTKQYLSLANFCFNFHWKFFFFFFTRLQSFSKANSDSFSSLVVAFGEGCVPGVPYYIIFSD